MAVFPLFVELEGKKCIVIGGGKVSERKLQTLLEFNADVTVISPEITEKIEQYKYENKLIVIKKNYSEEDIKDAFLVIVATNDRIVNEKIAFVARKMNIFVNVADCPEKCTFIFPSVVKRNDLVIGISTSGGYPSVTKKIRGKIDEMFPVVFGDVLKILKETRKTIEDNIDSINTRKRLLNLIADEVFSSTEELTTDQLKLKIKSIFEEYENEKNN